MYTPMYRHKRRLVQQRIEKIALLPSLEEHDVLSSPCSSFFFSRSPPVDHLTALTAQQHVPCRWVRPQETLGSLSFSLNTEDHSWPWQMRKCHRGHFGTIINETTSKKICYASRLTWSVKKTSCYEMTGFAVRNFLANSFHKNYFHLLKPLGLVSLFT